jgi:hypothetical protein
LGAVRPVYRKSEIMETGYLVATVLLSSIASVGVAYIFTEYFGRRWVEYWLDELDAFVAKEEQLLLQTKSDFILELTEMKTFVDKVPMKIKKVKTVRTKE